ncbi:MAG: nickel pincer cofactor biosynthesis protein LarB [Armatimonadia bacterium]
MNENDLRELMACVAQGALAPDEAVERLRVLPFEDLGFAKVDHHRALRTGFPEVIYCEQKTPEQVVEIAARIKCHAPVVLATRADRAVYDKVAERFPDCRYDEAARVITLGQPEPCQEGCPTALIITAGTSDIPVAEEAALVVEAASVPVKRLFDVGVAGLHRLLQHHEDLMQAGALVVVAGMEGALASVVGGLVARPVIGVPTSVGYGASFGGVAALLGMLNSCASGLAVVNIDNGFGAGYMAAMICKLAAPKQSE